MLVEHVLLGESLEGFGFAVAQRGYHLLVQNLQIPRLQVFGKVNITGVSTSEHADSRETTLAPHVVSEFCQLGGPLLLVVQVYFLPQELELHHQVLAP